MKKQKVHTLLSVLSIVAGAILTAYMIAVESEPGAIPLLLLVAGIGWYIVTRVRIRTHNE